MKRSAAAYAAATLVSFAAFIPAAQAGSSFEFLFSSNSVSNDNQYFLHLAVGNYDYPRTVVEPCLPRLRSVETDLPVVLFLAHSSRRPIDFIVSLREEGLAWSVIFGRCDVSYDVLFADIDRDPGPPYGKAWGHWKKDRERARLSDDQIVGLVQVQTARRVTNVSAFDIAHASGQGKSVVGYVADKKGRPHGHGDKADKGGGKRGKPGKGHKKS